MRSAMAQYVTRLALVAVVPAGVSGCASFSETYVPPAPEARTAAVPRTRNGTTSMPLPSLFAALLAVLPGPDFSVPPSPVCGPLGRPAEGGRP